MRSGNGDVFFVSLAKVFFANSHVPWNFNTTSFVKDGDFEYDASLIKTELKKSVGGGVKAF